MKESEDAKTPEKQAALTAEINEIQDRMPEMPVEPVLLEDDITPEALCSTLEDNGKVGFMAAEGGLFDILGGRYSNGKANLDLMVKTYDGEYHRQKRSSPGRPPYVLYNCLTAMSMSPQPHILEGIMRRPEFRSQGFLARFIYLLPESMAGFRNDDESKDIPEYLSQQYERVIREIIEMEDDTTLTGTPRPWRIKLSTEAYEIFREYRARVERELRPDGKFADVRDWSNRAPTTAIKLAGLFHIAEHVNRNARPAVTPIPDETMANVIELMGYLEQHMLVAFLKAGNDEAKEAARRILTWIQDDKPESFRPRQAFERVKGRVKTMEAVHDGLRVLHDHGYVFPQDVETQRGRGRKPGTLYKVNPRAYQGERHA